MLKLVHKRVKVTSLILEILQSYYSIASREGIEALKTIYRMCHECIMFYCFSLDLFNCFCGISRQTLILINYEFFLFYRMVGIYKINQCQDCSICLTTSRSCGNISCFEQKYQSDERTLEVSFETIKCSVAMFDFLGLISV